jgi:hypothetical protein
VRIVVSSSFVNFNFIEELESIIVEHNDKEDDVNLHISTTDDIAKAILLEIYVSTPTLDFEVLSCSDSHGKPHLNSGVIIH